MLQLKKITKRYTTGTFTQTALDGIDLEFRPSEFVAVLGPSGSGKTTFLNIIGGLDQYDSGDLVINGRSTKDFKDRDWDAYRNNSVGFIFQSYNLIGHLSIVDNVEMGLTLSGVSRAEKHQKATEALKRVGLADHLHKRPGQLSGGQMQRVAIARALAGDPDIILADEPTGALDTHTSVQIMELIREIAKDKLVIMVTHNPQLAEDYADRIVQFRDGQVIADSDPVVHTGESERGYTLKKTSMNFLTALKLSGKNISTKKGRTALTAFASSIGIIGIALVLSLSNGFDKQISLFESDTLSGFPVMITQQAVEMDMDTMIEQHSQMMGSQKRPDEYPDKKQVLPYDPAQNSMVHQNTFTQEYLDYVEHIDGSLLSGISYTRTVNMNLLHQDDSGDVTAASTSNLNFAAYPTSLKEGGEDYLQSSYDLLAGSYPQEDTDLVLIVDSYNQIDQNILTQLGIDSSGPVDFDDIVGKTFKIAPNDLYYTQIGSWFTVDSSAEHLRQIYDSEDCITVKIAGILRADQDTKLQVLSAGVAYSDKLTQRFIDSAQDSAIVKAQQEADYNVLTGQRFDDAAAAGNHGGSQNAATKEQILAALGGDSTPYMIALYPVDFAAKEKVTTYLADYNQGRDSADQVIYTDMAATFTSLSGGIMDAITLVLVAFAAVSLVVSLIMIGIITYISVLERTREIGVLRALGARKKDITRVFNAETFIIGACSGLMGIGIAYLLTFPVNHILKNLTDLSNVAQLNPVHAILLVVVSVALTMLGGMIPARLAAKKDPVEALRSE
ncbi:ATP-binding cassette domain-containing protein [Neobittarella massiliensis]|uniref:ATP-binding cassette domain-containing protein n=1 Tax=Neobittarella massiliensis (ex Bilen et al. 2018) TaxID=2041842 RepID=A0A8J6IK92_9FIRM|nr:ABC transporter ATP-binding protein/permease [Neobittarella massiliensis]MBC3516116.1 ATP-binding cassette domain-containing protein [Neobittarella massiliensis]